MHTLLTIFDVTHTKRGGIRFIRLGRIHIQLSVSPVLTEAQLEAKLAAVMRRDLAEYVWDCNTEWARNW